MPMQQEILIPPQNLEAEQSLLGSILLDPEAMTKIADILVADDFYKEAHRMIFQAIGDLYEKHDPIDVLSLSNRLEEKNHLQEIGGRSYLMSLANAVPASNNIVHYAHIIQKKATLRRLQTAAVEISEMIFKTDEEIQIVLDKAEQKIFGISQKLLKKVFTPMKDILAEAFERIDELHREKGKLRGIATGFADLDSMLAGFQKSDLVILAARPSVGKTSLALDIARQMAIISGVSVGIFSLEMSKEQLVDRLICAQANVDLWKMRTGKLSEKPDSDEFVRIGHAIDILSQAKIFIDDTASSNIMEIRTKARRLKSEHGLDIIILDYLQLMEGLTKTEGRVQEVAEITRGLKSIARELNIPILGLSQLARAVELNKPAIPKLSHLRESGSIEQDADVVLFIYRKGADRNYRFDELSEEEKHTAEVFIAKHRNGPTGTVRFFWDEKRASFRGLEQRREAASSAPSIFNAPF